MTEQKYYTAKQIEEAFGTPVSTVIDMWKNKRFPNAKIDENKTILIPEDDLKTTKIIKEVAPLTKQQEPPPDFSKLRQEAEEYAKSVKEEADSYAKLIKSKAEEEAHAILDNANLAKNKAEEEAKAITDNANSVKDEMMKRIDDECASRMKQADDAVKVAEDTIAKKTQELKKLQENVMVCLKKYNEIRKAVVDNRSYHYNLMMRDTWGRLMVWMGNLFKG